MYINSFNKHWEKDFFYNIPFKRDYFNKLLPKFEDKFIMNLVWIRRVWKTTLIKQFIDYLIQEKNVNRKNILFYSFDELWEIEEKIEEYKKITEIDLEKDKIYIFLDEIQKIKDWQSKVKIYYDLYPNIKFILSGSSLLFLQKKNH
jgi:predicted AAA+ superfamily ATPase